MARNRAHLDDEDDFPRRRKRARRKSRGGMFWALGGLGFAFVVVVVAAIALTAGRKRDGSKPSLTELANGGGPVSPVDQPGAAFPYGDWDQPTDTPLDPALPPEAGLVGQWRIRYEGRRMEGWTVRCPRAGKWVVLGYCSEDSGLNGVGFVGTDVEVSGRNLSFTKHFDKAPPPPWVGGAAVTAQLVDRKMTLEDGENPPFKGNKVTMVIGGKTYRVEQRKLLFTWRVGSDSGSGTMELIERQTPLVPARVP